SFSAPSNFVASGATVTVTVAVLGFAPAGGIPITLSTTNAAVLAVPAAVTVAAGAHLTTFTTTAGFVVVPTPVTLTAAAGGVTVSGSITVQPPPPSTIVITTAQLLAGQLLIQGSGALPAAVLAVNGNVLGGADPVGAFQIQLSAVQLLNLGFSTPPNC